MSDHRREALRDRVEYWKRRLRVPNHGKLYKALMAAHVPDWRRHESRRLAG